MFLGSRAPSLPLTSSVSCSFLQLAVDGATFYTETCPGVSFFVASGELPLRKDLPVANEGGIGSR